MNNFGKIKTLLVALVMGGILFAYGYVVTQWGHDQSHHEHHDDPHNHAH